MPTAKAKAKAKTEVATKAKEGSKELAQTNEVPAFLADKMESQRGSEAVTAEDLTIPRLEQAQALSKCVKKGNANHIEGIEEGDFYNNVTRENYGKEVTLIPVFFKKEYLIWRDQEQGGGFAGFELTEALAQVVVNDQEHPKEWAVVDTHQQFCILVKEDGHMEQIVVSMSKSKAKVSRKWNSLIAINQGDRFTRQYLYTSIEDTNSNNQNFANSMVSNKGFVTEEQFAKAEETFELINKGIAQADRTVDMDEDDLAPNEGTEY